MSLLRARNPKSVAMIGNGNPRLEIVGIVVFIAACGPFNKFNPKQNL